MTSKIELPAVTNPYAKALLNIISKYVGSNADPNRRFEAAIYEYSIAHHFKDSDATIDDIYVHIDNDEILAQFIIYGYRLLQEKDDIATDIYNYADKVFDAYINETYPDSE